MFLFISLRKSDHKSEICSISHHKWMLTTFCTIMNELFSVEVTQQQRKKCFNYRKVVRRLKRTRKKISKKVWSLRSRSRYSTHLQRHFSTVWDVCFSLDSLLFALSLSFAYTNIFFCGWSSASECWLDYDGACGGLAKLWTFRNYKKVMKKIEKFEAPGTFPGSDGNKNKFIFQILQFLFI